MADGQTDGSRSVGGQMDRQRDGSLEQWIDGWTDRRTAMGQWGGGRTDRRTGRQSNGPTDRRTAVGQRGDGQTDGRPPEWKDADTAMADGRTDRRTDLAVQQRLLLLQLLWGLGAKQRLQDRTLGETPPQFLLQGGIADWGGAIN